MKLFLLFLFASFGSGALFWKATTMQRAGIMIAIIVVITFMYFTFQRFV